MKSVLCNETGKKYEALQRMETGQQFQGNIPGLGQTHRGELWAVPMKTAPWVAELSLSQNCRALGRPSKWQSAWF